MKKLLFFIFVSFLFSIQFVLAQEVYDIRAIQDGSNIKIFYKIRNSTPEQLFRVEILARVNNRDTIKVVHASGDIGDNIIGGKDIYEVEWEVLKDVDNLKSVQIIIVLKKKKDGSTLRPIRPYRNGNFFVSLQTVGAKFGYRSKFGMGFGFASDLWDQNVLYLDLSARIVNIANFKLDFYPTIGVDLSDVTFCAGGGIDVIFKNQWYFNFDIFVDTFWGEVNPAIGFGIAF